MNDTGDPIQDAREEAERRQRRRGNPAAPTSSSAAFCTALALFIQRDRVQAAWHLRRAAGTLRRSFVAALGALAVIAATASPAAAEGETCATASDCRACPAGQHAECVETADVNFLHCVCKDGAPGACAAGGGGAGGAAWGLVLLALLPRRRPGCGSTCAAAPR